MSADEKSARSTCSATRSSDFDTETSAPCGNRRRRRPPKIRDGQNFFQDRCGVFGPGVEFTGKGGEEPLSGEERAGRLLLSAQRFAARVPGLRGPRRAEQAGLGDCDLTTLFGPARPRLSLSGVGRVGLISRESDRGPLRHLQREGKVLPCPTNRSVPSRSSARCSGGYAPMRSTRAWASNSAPRA